MRLVAPLFLLSCTGGPPSWYADADGDGFGDPASRTAATEAPAGHVRNALDCDDTDPGIHPGAEERCNGRDDDCDWTVDDDAVDAGAGYADLDGDGWGAEWVEGCDTPEPLSEVGDDCDDEDAEIHPLALEICGDEVDQDCDGSAPECGLFSASSIDDAAIRLSGSDAEWAGYVWMVPDVTADGIDDLLVGAPQQPGGGVYVVSTGGATTDLSDYPVITGTVPARSWRRAAAWIPDINGDGIGEVALTETDYLHVHLGPIEGDRAMVDGDIAIYGDAAGSSFGLSVAPMRGSSDAVVLVGDYGNDVFYNGDSYDVAYVVGRAYAFPADMETGNATEETSAIFRLSASHEGAVLGRTSCGGDLDGDGLDDAILGAPGKMSGSNTPVGPSANGAVYVVEAPFSPELELADESQEIADATAILWGEQYRSSAGMGLSCTGDVDGDGLDDLLVLASDTYTATWFSRVYVVTEAPRGEISLASSPGILQPTDEDELLVGSNTGDLDGDGVHEVLVGSYSAADDRSTTYIFWHGVTGVFITDDVDDRIQDHGEGETAAFVASGGDLDGDGYHDIAIGAPGADDMAGAVYLFFGGP